MVPPDFSHTDGLLAKTTVKRSKLSTSYSTHDGLQAAKGLVQILESMSRDGQVVLGHMTLRQGKKRVQLAREEYFEIALRALQKCLATYEPPPSRSSRERY